MQENLKTLIEESLKEHEKIKFDLTYVTKGCIVEIEIGLKRNEDCGPIYDQLSEWLGYDEFINYLIDRGVQHNFSGEIYRENGEICFLITLNGNCYEYDDSDRRCIEFQEDFISKELKIDLSEIGMKDFDQEKLSVRFNQMKGCPLENLKLYYFHDDWHQIELNIIQQSILTEFILSEIDKAAPVFDLDFDCEIIWEVECDEKCLEFNYRTSPIKLFFNEIVSK